MTRRLIQCALAALAIPVLCAAATSPKDAFEELLSIDRGFSTASAQTDLISGLSAMFADDVVIPMPPGKFVEGKAAVVAALRTNADNATSRTDWTPIGGGVSADGRQGFTFGYMTIRRGDNADVPLKYLAYWVKRPEGWRVVAYKRGRAGAGTTSRQPVAPLLPDRIIVPSSEPASLARAKESLDQAERAFSRDAQKIGIGTAFAQYGTADSVNLGRQDAPGFVFGSENIGRMVAEGSPPGASAVSWAPDRVIVSSSGDLGVTIGMIHANAPTPGQPDAFPFFTIWRRASTAAPWRYIAE